MALNRGMTNPTHKAISINAHNAVAATKREIVLPAIITIAAAIHISGLREAPKNRPIKAANPSNKISICSLPVYVGCIIMRRIKMHILSDSAHVRRRETPNRAKCKENPAGCESLAGGVSGTIGCRPSLYQRPRKRDQESNGRDAVAHFQGAGD